jgi:hypothetical protein
MILLKYVELNRAGISVASTLTWLLHGQTAQVLQKQIADLVEVCDITNYTTLNELQRIFLDFRLRGADLIARSRMLVCIPLFCPNHVLGVFLAASVVQN